MVLVRWPVVNEYLISWEVLVNSLRCEIILVLEHIQGKVHFLTSKHGTPLKREVKCLYLFQIWYPISKSILGSSLESIKHIYKKMFWVLVDNDSLSDLITLLGKFFWLRSVTKIFMNSLVPTWIWSGLPHCCIDLSSTSKVNATTFGSLVCKRFLNYAAAILALQWHIFRNR